MEKALDRPHERYVAAQADTWGWSVFGGWTLMRGRRWDSRLGAWAGAPWQRPTDPAAGARVEVRF